MLGKRKVLSSQETAMPRVAAKKSLNTRRRGYSPMAVKTDGYVEGRARKVLARNGHMLV